MDRIRVQSLCMKPGFPGFMHTVTAHRMGSEHRSEFRILLLSKLTPFKRREAFRLKSHNTIEILAIRHGCLRRFDFELHPRRIEQTLGALQFVNIVQRNLIRFEA